jgi:DNA repair and recombination protein RAD54B
MYRPFKPPMMRTFAPKKAAEEEERIPESDDESEVRPFKKRKLLVVDHPAPVKAVPVSSAGVLAPRKPLLAVKNSSEPKSASQLSNDCPEGYYMVLWYVNLIYLAQSS